MLPRDPDMLVSILNMKLRDFYPDFDALCDDMDEDKQEITGLLESAGYRYDPAGNSFRKAD